MKVFLFFLAWQLVVTDATGEACNNTQFSCPTQSDFCGLDSICYPRSCANLYKHRTPYYTDGSSEALVCDPNAEQRTLSTYKCSNGDPQERMRSTQKCVGKPLEDATFVCWEFTDDADFSSFEQVIDSAPCGVDDKHFVEYDAFYTPVYGDDTDAFALDDELEREPPFDKTFAKSFCHFATLVERTEPPTLAPLGPPTPAPQPSAAGQGLGTRSNYALLGSVVSVLISVVCF